MTDITASDVMTDYEEARRAFSWDIPATFNFGSDVVDQWAASHDGPALIALNENDEAQRYAYSDISRLTNRFANVLRSSGVKPGDRVVIMFPRLPYWQIAMVGALKAGAVPIPCIEMLTAKDIAYRVEHSGAVAAATLARNVDKFDGLNDQLKTRISVGAVDGWTDYDEAMTSAAKVFDEATTPAEAPAIMYYTSGSTGLPKGVMHPSRSLYAWRTAGTYWLDLRPDDVIWCTADTGWSKAGTSILFGPWSCGACAFFYDGPFDARRRLQLIQEHKISIFCASNTELNRLLNEDIASFDLSSLRRTVTAGEALSPVVAEKWRNATGCEVAQAYGQTETLMSILTYPNLPAKPGAMGLAAPGVDVEIIDDDGALLPAGEVGNIAIGAPCPQIMSGYWRDDERTKDSYLRTQSGDWFVTGDLGRKDEDGYFFFEGRNDDIINSSGYRIGPLEVEDALMGHDAVQECAVIGIPDSERGEVVKAFIVLKSEVDDHGSLIQDLQSHVKSVTAPYKYPRKIEFVTELPKTLTGKIQRSVLRAIEQESAKTK